MKYWKVLLSFSLLFSSAALHAASITIIESQSGNSGHYMDTNWLNVANSMGHTGSLAQQSTLDNTNFFSSTDMLIISSGVITLTSQRIETIRQYMQSGGSVYLQGEYSSTFNTNNTFETLVESFGGDFTWTGTVSGTLYPMNVTGQLSTTPNNITVLEDFWYGYAGYGDATIENFLEYQGEYFGFIFDSPMSGVGSLITTTDQDWVRTAASADLLMENIIASSVSAVPVPAAIWLFGSGLLGLLGMAKFKRN